MNKKCNLNKDIHILWSNLSVPENSLARLQPNAVNIKEKTSQKHRSLHGYKICKEKKQLYDFMMHFCITVYYCFFISKRSSAQERDHLPLSRNLGCRVSDRSWSARPPCPCATDFCQRNHFWVGKMVRKPTPFSGQNKRNLRPDMFEQHLLGGFHCHNS